MSIERNILRAADFKDTIEYFATKKEQERVLLKVKPQPFQYHFFARDVCGFTFTCAIVHTGCFWLMNFMGLKKNK